MGHAIAGPIPAAGVEGVEGAAARADEAALVRAAQADPAAFGVLYGRYLDPVYRYLRARTGDADEAADLTQAVFLRALEALPGYRDRGLPFAAWLFRIARNAAINHARRRPATPLGLLPEVEAGAEPAERGPEAQALRADDLRRLRGLVADLDPGKRELLELRFAAGLTTREIAAVVGKREAAVKKALARTLHALKERSHDL